MPLGVLLLALAHGTLAETGDACLSSSAVFVVGGILSTMAAAITALFIRYASALERQNADLTGDRDRWRDVALGVTDIAGNALSIKTAARPERRR